MSMALRTAFVSAFLCGAAVACSTTFIDLEFVIDVSGSLSTTSCHPTSGGSSCYQLEVDREYLEYHGTGTESTIAPPVQHAFTRGGTAHECIRLSPCPLQLLVT